MAKAQVRGRPPPPGPRSFPGRISHVQPEPSGRPHAAAAPPGARSPAARHAVRGDRPYSRASVARHGRADRPTRALAHPGPGTRKRPPVPAVGGGARRQNLIWLIVSAIESRNLLIDGAMPVDARKKPNSMATTAGPALMDPPRINTTRTIAKSSTTDSEMATTDHNPWSVRLAGRERCRSSTSSAGPWCHQQACGCCPVAKRRRSDRAIPRTPRVRPPRPARGPRPDLRGQFQDGSARHSRRLIRIDRFTVHTLRSQVIAIRLNSHRTDSEAGPETCRYAPFKWDETPHIRT